MSSYCSGNQSTSNVNQFMSLTTPVHLPPLISTNGVDSPYLPMSHKSQAPSIPGYTDIPPERQGVDFGQTDYFKVISNDNELMKTCELFVKLDGLNAGSNGMDPRYVDDLLCAAIEKVEFQFGGNTLAILYGDEIHFRNEQETPEEELDRKYKIQAAGLTPVRRALLATAPQWIKLEIPFWWARNSAASWHQYALQRTTRIAITWRDKGYLLQSDPANLTLPVGTPTTKSLGPYIMDHFIRCQVACVTEATKQAYLNQIMPTGKSGWLYMINDWERILNNQIYPAKQPEHIIQLNTLTKYGYNLRLWARPVLNLNPDVRNNRRWDRMDFKEVRLDVSGRTYLPKTDKDYMKFEVNAKKFLGNPNIPTYNIPLCDAPDLHTHAMGGLDFSNATTPQLILTSNPVGMVDIPYFVDVYLYCHNYVRLCLNGTSSAAEVVQPL